MPVAKITTKGQITIPKEVREALGVGAGDSVQFVLEGDEALLRPIRSGGLAALYGAFAPNRDDPLAKTVRELAARYSGEELVREVKKVEREAARQAAAQRRRTSQR